MKDPLGVHRFAGKIQAKVIAEKYKRPPNQICANCGISIPGSDLALISQAISGHKPVCSYECNKAMGQVK